MGGREIQINGTKFKDAEISTSLFDHLVNACVYQVPFFLQNAKLTINSSSFLLGMPQLIIVLTSLLAQCLVAIPTIWVLAHCFQNDALTLGCTIHEMPYRSLLAHQSNENLSCLLETWC